MHTPAMPSAPIAPPSALRVLIIDDDPIVCAEIERLLSHQYGIGEVVCISDPSRAVDEVRRRDPDVVLLDVDMRGISGLDLIAPILDADPATKDVMLSGLSLRGNIDRALDLGAAGYLVKNLSAGAMAGYIRRAAQDELVLCPTAGAAMMQP